MRFLLLVAALALAACNTPTAPADESNPEPSYDGIWGHVSTLPK
jgi:hypothetical protein